MSELTKDGAIKGAVAVPVRGVGCVDCLELMRGVPAGCRPREGCGLCHTSPSRTIASGLMLPSP